MTRHTLLPVLTLAAVLLATTGSDAAPVANSLTLHVDLHKPGGRLLIALHDSEESYRSNRPFRRARIDVTTRSARSTFADLPPGVYAVKMFHDINGNDRLDTNSLGIPSEPIAFTNNARARFGPASWAQASVSVSGPVVQTIRVR